MLRNFWKNYGPLSVGIAILLAILLPALAVRQQDLGLILLLFALILLSIVAGHIIAQLLMQEHKSVDQVDERIQAELTEEYEIPGLEHDNTAGEELSQILLTEIHQEGLFYDSEDSKKPSSAIKSAS